MMRTSGKHGATNIAIQAPSIPEWKTMESIYSSGIEKLPRKRNASV